MLDIHLKKKKTNCKNKFNKKLPCKNFVIKKMSKNIKVNNKSYKTNNDIVKLDFQDEKSDNEDTEFNERNKKRTYSIDNKESVMVTPKKNALDMIKSKIQTSPNKTYQKNQESLLQKLNKTIH